MSRLPDKVLFWDFDGTLASAPGLWVHAIYSELEDTLPGNGIGMERVREKNQTGYPWHHPERDHRALIRPGAWWTYMETVFTGIYRNLGIDEKTSSVMAGRIRRRILDPRNYTLLPDALQVLTSCRDRGYANWLLSNHMPELGEVLSALGLAPLLDGVLLSAEIGYEKPHPAVFDIALERTGHPDTRYMIGDNPIADIAGAKRAGIPAILVETATGHPWQPGPVPPDFTCSRLMDILDFIP
ncbi:MAG: HAD-IA family hydrolase [Clostridiaceae bacterium]|nr:HAD-IA family hydrolase [Clostridiaceae bacterium]